VLYNEVLDVIRALYTKSYQPNDGKEYIKKRFNHFIKIPIKNIDLTSLSLIQLTTNTVMMKLMMNMMNFHSMLKLKSLKKHG